ncbi:MAG: heme ABC transporter ATP-binding protein [Pseudomonadota bacterium]
MSLAASNVSVERGSRTIVEDISLSLCAGATTALVGPNGAGKSTVLRTLAGEFSPLHGSVTVDDLPIEEVPPDHLARRRGVMTQSSAVAFDFSVAEILDLGWIPGREVRHAHKADAINTIVGRCRIQHLLHRTFNTLSGGEQQRVQFARVLLQIWRPDGSEDFRYLLLDEPTASLDIAHERALLELARAEAARGAGVLCVLHDLNLAARYFDQVAIMFEGRIVAFGDPAETFTDETLSDVYATPVSVEWHSELERIVVHT